MPATAEDDRISENAAFITRALGDRHRVLEVGCGRGALAQTLAARGFEVTALDVALRDLVEAPGVRFVERNFLEFEGEQFDAIVFTSSLHHIAPLPAAIDRAAELLVPGGRLIADEFDLDAPDEATLRWYYDRVEPAHGDHGHGDGGHGDDDPVARWQHAHQHHGERLHAGHAMLAAISARFVIREEARLEYLYRYVAHHVGQDAAGAAAAAQLRADEQHGITTGALRPVGLRMIADLRA